MQRMCRCEEVARSWGFDEVGLRSLSSLTLPLFLSYSPSLSLSLSLSLSRPVSTFQSCEKRQLLPRKHLPAM